MESRRDSTLCSPRVAIDEDQDFLSRYVNLGWDADSSEWNYRDDYPDTLSSEHDLLKLFGSSREHSFEKVHEDVKSLRKSSLEKPVGLLMNPRTYVCESLKSSCWGKFLSSEKRVCDSNQAYLKENIDCNKVKIEQNEDESSGQQRQSVASGRRRSKSVNDLFLESTCEKERVVDQELNQSLKQEGKEENTCGIKRATNRLSKQFSVYNQNFDLNTRFLSKSHYHISHWRPEKSRVKTKENLTNRKNQFLNVSFEERLTFKKNDNDKETEIEEVRRKFNTEKNYRSWVWEPENSPVSNKLKIFGKANPKQQNFSSKSLKTCSSTEFANKKIKSQKNFKETRKIAGPTRQLSQGTTTSSTVSLPAISSHNNMSSVSRQKSPHKLGHFPSISTDNLMKQYQKYHDEFIKQKK